MVEEGRAPARRGLSASLASAALGVGSRPHRGRGRPLRGRRSARGDGPLCSCPRRSPPLGPPRCPAKPRNSSAPARPGQGVGWG
eukprot:scaffold125268_cov36-Phaeocystis_antarctica.AAC.1